MMREAASEGEVGPASKRVQKIQIVTIDQLFQPHPVDLPGMLDPPEVVMAPAFQPKRSRKKQMEGQTELLLPIKGEKEPFPKQRVKRSIRELGIEVTRPYIGRKGK